MNQKAQDIISTLARKEPDSLHTLIRFDDTIVPVLEYIEHQKTIPSKLRERISFSSNETTIDYFTQQIESWDSFHMNYLISEQIRKGDYFANMLASSDWDEIKKTALKTSTREMVTAICYGTLNIKPDLFDFVKEVYRTKPEMLKFILLINLNYALQLVKDRSTIADT